MTESSYCHAAVLKVLLGLLALPWVLTATLPVSAQPLSAPATTGPLQMALPTTFNAGPLGKLDVTGTVSGMGLWQGNHIPGDEPSQAALTNGQVFIQKTTGWWQFYLQAGAYNLPALATPFLSTSDTMSDFYGPLPVGYLKLDPTKNSSVLIGKLPSLVGGEYTFDFENMNIERGLLWNQGSSVSRGVQINDRIGRLSGSISWNDGFYSNRYTWVTGSISYAVNASNTFTFVGGGNLGQTAFRTLATPVQNNSQIYDVIYSYTHGPWNVEPYFQYTSVPTDPRAGILHGAATQGEALLLTYRFTHHISLAGRAEYISSTGNNSVDAVNLLFGPGSSAWSVTLTPTFTDHDFFMRGEFSLVQAQNLTPGDGFGSLGLKRAQARGLVEVGFMF